jgi:hypothetical protein
MLRLRDAWMQSGPGNQSEIEPRTKPSRFAPIAAQQMPLKFEGIRHDEFDLYPHF